MTLQTLFDERRRKEISDALAKGRRIRFRASISAPDILQGDSEAGQENLKRYMFTFHGTGKDGKVMLEVQTRTGEVVGKAACEVGAPNRIKLSDGNEITLTPGNPYDGNAGAQGMGGEGGRV